MSKWAIETLPEDAERVEAYDRALRQHSAAILDETAALMARYEERGITTIKGCGWPLRPLFLKRRTLDTLGALLFQAYELLSQELLSLLDQPEELARQLPLAPAIFDVLDFRQSIQSKQFLSVMRPDGFLFEDRFSLIEPNFGNGSMISNAYTEIIYDFFQGASTFKALQWDVAGHLDRPFQRFIEMIRSFLPKEQPAPFVALFCHHWELQVIKSWEPRVVHQLYLAQQLLEEAGIANRVVHEDAFEVDGSGQTILKEDGQRVDGVVQFTIGTSFLDEPERFQEELSLLTGPTIGSAPLLKPLASLCIDKGTMPWMSSMPHWPLQGDGLRLEVPWSRYPEEADAVEYRTQREQFVLKKSFDGKDTHVGVSARGRHWNRVLQKAMGSKEYIIQRYQPMSRTIMPMCFDGKQIEWVPVRVELSPFLINGRYAGAIARYAPDAEGIVMSPPPEQMGLTNVFAC